MVNRTVAVTFSANVGPYSSKVEGAAKSTDRLADSAVKAERGSDRMGDATARAAGDTDTFGAKAERMRRSVDQNREAWDRSADRMLVAGTIAAGGVTAVAKAAIDWETAWAGVVKTTDGSPEEMAALEGELRNLARTLPVAHAEIAGVAEAAGQLGVKREDVADFTQIMLEMGESTTLTSDEAATSMAQFANVMGTPQEDIRQTADTVVELGNNSATTEGKIMHMGQRISGAAKTVGASETETLALAAALSSVGIEAERGSGVMQRAMLDINSAVMDGGSELDAYAEIAGVTAQEFSETWRRSPVEAIDLFTTGLGRIKDEGGNVTAALHDVGIKGTEDVGVFSTLAGAGDVLTESLNTANGSLGGTSELSEEFGARMETDAAKIGRAWNQVKDAAIDLGGAVAPVLGDMAELVGGAATAFQKLPQPIQDSVGLVAGFGGAGLIAAGGVIKLANGTQDLARDARDLLKPLRNSNTQVKGLGKNTGKARGNVRKFGAALGAAAGAAVLMAAGAERAREDSENMAESMSRVTGSLEAGADGSQLLADTLKDAGMDKVAGDAEQFSWWLDRTTASSDTYTGAGQRMTGALDGLTETFGVSIDQGDTFRERMAGLGEKIAEVAESDVPAAVETFRELADETDGSREAQGRLLEAMPALRDSLQRQADAAGIAREDQDLLAIALGETVLPAKDAAGGADEVAASTEGAAEQIAALAEATPELTDQLASTENGWTVMVEGAEDAEDATERAQSSVDEFIDSISSMNGEFLDERAAQRQWVEALEGVDAALKENGRTLDINTEKGRKNQEALDGLAGNLGALIEAQAKGGASAEQLTAEMEKGREKIVEVARQFGYTREEAERYADTLGLTPELVESEIIARGIDTGIEGSQNLQFEMGKIPREVETQISMAGEVLASEKLRMVEDGQARIDPFVTTGVRVNNAVEATAALGGVAEAQDRVDPFTTTGVRAENAVEVAGQIGNITAAQGRVDPFTTTAVSAPNAVEVAGQLQNVTDKAGAIPAEERVAVSTPGTESAREQLIRVDAAAIELSNGETVDLSTPGWGESIEHLQAVDVEAIRLSNGEEIPIEAPGWHQTRDALSWVDETARAVSDAENVAVTETGSRGVQAWLDRVDAEARAMSDGENVAVTETGAYSTRNAIWNVDAQADRLDGRVVDVTIRQQFTTAGERIRGAVAPWFDTGGYTGPGGKYDPKGIVHAGEFVHTQEELQAPGARQFHDALWQRKGRTDYNALTRALRGYAGGGYVDGPLGLGGRGAGRVGAGFTFGAGFDPRLLTRAARDAITSMDWDLLRAMIGDGWQDAMTAADWEAVGALAADQMTLRGHQAGAAFGAAQAATTEVAMADVADIVMRAVDRQGQHVAGGLSTAASATEVAMADLTGTVAGAVDRQHQDVAGGLSAVVAATDQTVGHTRRVVDADLSTTGSRTGRALTGMSTATQATAAGHRATVDGALGRSTQSTSAALAGIRGETTQSMGQVRAEVESTLSWARSTTRGTLESLEDAAQSTVAGVRRQVQSARAELASVRAEAAREETRRAAKPKPKPKPRRKRQTPLTYDWARAARNAGKPEAYMRRLYGPGVAAILAGSVTRWQAGEDLWGLLMDQGWKGGTASGAGRLRAPSRSAIERALRFHRDRYVTGRFDTGGYTGDGSKYDPKGVVHAREFVHTKEELDRPGALAFHTELWRRQGATDYRALTRALGGYATGGPVAVPAPMRVFSQVAPPPSAPTGPTVKQTVHNYYPIPERGSQAASRAARYAAAGL